MNMSLFMFMENFKLWNQKQNLSLKMGKLLKSR